MPESAVERPDAQEAAQLQALAKISPAQPAQAAVPGTVGQVQLTQDEGHLIYVVSLGQTEVSVDAGTGSVLHQKATDPERVDGADTND